jgi:hypothetical protein
MTRISEVKGWLKEKEPRFMAKLEEIGVRRGFGQQAVIDGKVETDVDGGEFTGFGLCYVAAGAIEAASQKKFGNTVKTEGVIVEPIRKDTGRKNDFSHHAIRLEAEDGKVTADATFRQLNFDVRNQVYVFPTTNESKVYRGGREVRTLYSGSTAFEARQSMGKGFVANSQEKDFVELVNTLTE